VLVMFRGHGGNIGRAKKKMRRTISTTKLATGAGCRGLLVRRIRPGGGDLGGRDGFARFTYRAR